MSNNIVLDYQFLRKRSEKVESVEEAKQIVEKLQTELKKHTNGIGLSAVQIGIPKRISVIKYDKRGEEFITLINPEFVELGEEFTFSGEGCLSFPGIYRDTIRHVDFTIKNYVIEGDSFREETLAFYYSGLDKYGLIKENDLESIAVEHEMDHMDGKIIVDYGKVTPVAIPFVRSSEKISRNDPCPCGSGKKYKKCCLK